MLCSLFLLLPYEIYTVDLVRKKLSAETTKPALLSNYST